MRTIDENLRSEMLQMCKNIESIIARQRVKGINSPCFDQIKRSSTSIGANFCEAQGCYTDKDYRKTIAVSIKETHETIWWLDVLFHDDAINEYELEQYKKIYKHILQELENLFTESMNSESVPTAWGNRLKGR